MTNMEEIKRIWNVREDNDREVVIKGLRKFGNLLVFASQQLCNDYEVVEEAVKRCGLSLQYTSKELRDNRDIVIMAVRNNGISLEYASKLLRKDKEIVLLAVNNRGDSLKFADDIFRDDREICHLAVERVGISLKYASKKLRNNRELVEKAIIQSRREEILSYASQEMRNDINMVLFSVQKNENSLRYASEEIKNSVEFFERLILMGRYRQNQNLLKICFSFAGSKILSSDDFFIRNIPINGGILPFSSMNIRSDKELVLQAVKNKGEILQFASDELRNDKDVVLSALKCKSCVLEFASEELKDDSEIVLEAVSNSGMNLRYVSERYRDDISIVKEAVRNIPRSLIYASDRMKNDESVFLLGIEIDALQTVNSCGEEIKRNREMIKKALEKCGMVLCVSLPEHRDDRELVRISIQNSVYGNIHSSDSCPISYASSILRSDKELVIEAMKEYPNHLRIMSVIQYPLCIDRDFILESVRINGLFLQNTFPRFMNDKGVILEAFRQNRKAIEFANWESIHDLPFMISLLKSNTSSEKNEVLRWFQSVYEGMLNLDLTKTMELNNLRELTELYGTLLNYKLELSLHNKIVAEDLRMRICLVMKIIFWDSSPLSLIGISIIGKNIFEIPKSFLY